MHYQLDCLNRVRKGLPLCSRDGTLLEGSARRRMMLQLRGVSCPNFETKPLWKFEEVLAMERAGSTLWEATSVEDSEVRRSTNLFCRLVLNELRSGGDLQSASRAWTILCSSEPVHKGLFAEGFGIDCVHVSRSICFAFHALKHWSCVACICFDFHVF